MLADLPYVQLVAFESKKINPLRAQSHLIVCFRWAFGLVPPPRLARMEQRAMDFVDLLISSPINSQFQDFFKSSIPEKMIFVNLLIFTDFCFLIEEDM